MLLLILTLILLTDCLFLLIQIEGRQVAIKKVGDVFSDLVDAKRIVREIKLLRHFDGHENIINIMDIMTMPPDTTDFKDVYIVTNLMESDMDRIISSGQPLTDQHFQYFIYQASGGLTFTASFESVVVTLSRGDAFKDNYKY